MTALTATTAVPTALYRPARRTPIGKVRYRLAKPGTAKRLEKKLSRLGRSIRADQMRDLRAAREALRGDAVMFVRIVRGMDPMTKQAWLMKEYCALPLDYPLRVVKVKGREA